MANLSLPSYVNTIKTPCVKNSRIGQNLLAHWIPLHGGNDKSKKKDLLQMEKKLKFAHATVLTKIVLFYSAQLAEH